MRILIATAVFVLGVAVGAAQEDKKATDPSKDVVPAATADKVAVPPSVIEGGYTIAAVERDGKPVPLDGYKDAIVRIVNGQIIATDRDRREFLVAKYKLKTEKQPWALDMELRTTKADEVKGLVKKDGYVLTLIYALPGGAAPTEFKTKQGQQMFVLRGFILDPLPPPNKFSNSP